MTRMQGYIESFNFASDVPERCACFRAASAGYFLLFVHLQTHYCVLLFRTDICLSKLMVYTSGLDYRSTGVRLERDITDMLNIVIKRNRNFTLSVTLRPLKEAWLYFMSSKNIRIVPIRKFWASLKITRSGHLRRIQYVFCDVLEKHPI